MKEEIEKYLRTDRTYAAGVKLYQKFGHNPALLRKFIHYGENKTIHEVLYYQLWKLTGESEKMLNEILMQPFDPYVEPKNILKQIVESTEAAPATAPVTISVTEAVKFKLREEFPFLADKSCPDAFKILVADMMTAHDNYMKAHEDLFNITNEDEAFEAADKLINNYLDNQSIWKELNHYKTTGAILGKHPYFQDQNRQKELTAKSVPDLMIMLRNIEHSIWRVTKKMKDDPKPELVAKREKAIRDYERDKKIIKSLLNINE